MPTIIRTRARNYVAMSPLMRKGGVHEKSKSSVRSDAKHQLQAEMLNWREALEEEHFSENTTPQNDSGEVSYFTIRKACDLFRL